LDKVQSDALSGIVCIHFFKIILIVNAGPKPQARRQRGSRNPVKQLTTRTDLRTVEQVQIIEDVEETKEEARASATKYCPGKFQNFIFLACSLLRRRKGCNNGREAGGDVIIELKSKL